MFTPCLLCDQVYVDVIGNRSLFGPQMCMYTAGYMAVPEG